MSEFKVGDEVIILGVVTHEEDRDGDIKVKFHGDWDFFKAEDLTLIPHGVKEALSCLKA